jgi:hypothetical protein
VCVPVTQASIARVQYKASTRLIETGKPTLAERSYNPK